LNSVVDSRLDIFKPKIPEFSEPLQKDESIE
jgi:hypothetical protein